MRRQLKAGMYRLLRFMAFASLAVPAVASTQPSVPPADAPSLAALGPNRVGTATISLPAASAQAPDRTLRVVIWYPSRPAPGARTTSYRHSLRPAPPLRPLDVEIEAIAVAEAPPISGTFPLVIVSHGYRGWPESMSYLTENLASKGYIVAGIDHGDLPYGDAAGFQRSFATTAATRARDQQLVLTRLTGRNAPLPMNLGGRIDTNRLALIGYSMGGFGALATAGAGYDPASHAYRSLPQGALADQAEGRRRADPRLRALVAIAPWGAQPPHRAWSAAALGQIKVPMLVIAGEEDDISGYPEGIRWVYDNARGSDRLLLLYRNARHNVGGNPAPAAARGDFGYLSWFEEPVWRQERLNAINQHFVTAFLDRHVKGDLASAKMLTAPADGAAGWRGFQPRWSLGFDLLAAPAE